MRAALIKRASLLAVVLLSVAGTAFAQQLPAPPAPAPMPIDACTNYRVAMVSKPDTAILGRTIFDIASEASAKSPDVLLKYQMPIVRLAVRSDGHVVTAGILQSSGNRDIDKTVVEWAKQIVVSEDECSQKRTRSLTLPINISNAVNP